MADITLCLITKGRSEFIDQLLTSFDQALKNDKVNILVVLNGANSKVIERFQEWGIKHADRVDFVIFLENQANNPQAWNKILSLKTKWVMFPSDDDVINDDFSDVVNTLGIIPPSIGAVATSMKVIDLSGNEFGILRKPFFSPQLSVVENAARAISQCPFLWPSLIIRVSSLPQQVPHSRYVFDWWIGLYLIFTSGISTMESPTISYRVHNQQESSVASLSRKNLEALTHLGEFFESQIFTNWLIARSPQEVIEFLLNLAKYPPLYGEMKFSSQMVSIITNRVMSLRNEIEVNKIALFTKALAHDVLIDETQLKYLSKYSNLKSVSGIHFNYFFRTNPAVCSRIKTIFNSSSQPMINLPILRVCCNHTAKTEEGIKLNCDEDFSREDLIDQLHLKSTEYFQSRQYFQKSVSPFEYRIIIMIRKLKHYAPKKNTKEIRSIEKFLISHLCNYYNFKT